MKLTYIASSTTIVEHKNTKILTDPWVLGEPFFGSWTHYPKVEPNLDILNSVDYIYISHIHQDHADEETLRAISDDIPILIYDFLSPGLKLRLESYGKKVITLKHGKEFDCGDGLKISIWIADNCDPEVCFKHFGCGKMEKNFRSSTIDTLAVFSNGDKVILNTNDCPYTLSKNTVKKILSKYPKIDFLLTGYAGASAYPQCFEHYSNEEKLNYYGDKYRKLNLDFSDKFIEHTNPTTYMPFAGTYTLSGKLAKLEKYKGVVTLEDALKYFKSKHKNRGILLNSWEYFDLNTEKVSSPYIPIDYEKRKEYIENVLSKKKFTYEYNPTPTLDEILDLIPGAYKRFENMRNNLEYSNEIKVYIYLSFNKLLELSFNGDGYNIINEEELNKDNFLSYRLDPKLLYLILKGPKYAHWNYCEGGSHITFNRNPDIHHRAVAYCMNYFHN